MQIGLAQSFPSMIYDDYIKPYGCTFAVGALAGYFLTNSLVGILPDSFLGLDLSANSKLAIISGIYAAAAVPVVQTIKKYE